MDPFAVDVSSQAEVRRLAREVLAAYPRLDVLVNNAGGFWATRRVTADGLERTFAVNHLAPFLLSRLLLDRLKASAPARIVTVSSGAHTTGKIDFGDLQGERRYSGQRAYSQSKLANVMPNRHLGTVGCRRHVGHSYQPFRRAGHTGLPDWPATNKMEVAFSQAVDQNSVGQVEARMPVTGMLSSLFRLPVGWLRIHDRKCSPAASLRSVLGLLACFASGDWYVHHVVPVPHFLPEL